MSYYPPTTESDILENALDILDSVAKCDDLTGTAVVEFEAFFDDGTDYATAVLETPDGLRWTYLFEGHSYGKADWDDFEYEIDLENVTEIL